ncbi:MAG TPA: cyclic lactone autoinducer peptide [Syntrophomonadaceae bacterium]|nr:cyclic lactone autoinducer peptide [Syntrophomonadaceae bacterium]
MLKRVYLWALTLVAAAFVALANASAASACAILHYQPELPETLRKY